LLSYEPAYLRKRYPNCWGSGLPQATRKILDAMAKDKESNVQELAIKYMKATDWRPSNFRDRVVRRCHKIN